MNRETSLYLDAVRFLAAVAVFLDHVSVKRLTGGFLWQMVPYGDEAVTVFFVLSGFVIAYAVDTKEGTPSTYAVNRLARIYSVALPALVVTFALDAIGRSLRPDLFTMSWGYDGTTSVQQFLAGASFVNELWTWHIRQGSNVPYWSLGYEVWYYIAFGLAFFLKGRRRFAAAAGALVIAGPAIAVMFPLWLGGAGVYHLCKRRPPTPVAGLALFVAAIAVWLGYEVMAWTHGRWLLPDMLLLRRPQLLQDYLVATCFAATVIGFRGASSLLGPLLAVAARPIRWLAASTFTLYLFHVPVMQFIATLAPWGLEDARTRLLLIVATPAIIFLIAPLTERRKDAWRRVFLAVPGLRPRAA